jgi:hypothetical protein
MSRLLATAVAFLMPAVAAADGLELAGYLGRAVPTYSQSFSYAPISIPPPFPGVSVEQTGSFGLDASGGVVFGAGLTWFLADAVGIEGRLDTADVDIETSAPSFVVRVDLPTPLPDLSTDVVLDPASVSLKRLTPVSLNLLLRTPGPLGLRLSGGVTFLPDAELSVVQNVGLAGTPLDVFVDRIDVATLPIRAEAAPSEGGPRLGGNAGAGLQLRLGERLTLMGEARVFFFGAQTLQWSRVPGVQLSAIEELALTEIERQLAPIEFDLVFFNVTAGLALSF